MALMAAGGAGLGYLKNKQDVKNEASDRAAAASTIRYSPWTGMQPGQIRKADLMGSMLQGATGLGMMGLNMGQANAKNDLLAAQSDALTARTNAMQSNAALGHPGPIAGLGGGQPSFISAPSYAQTFNPYQYLQG